MALVHTVYNLKTNFNRVKSVWFKKIKEIRSFSRDGKELHLKCYVLRNAVKFRVGLTNWMFYSFVKLEESEIEFCLFSEWY